MHSLLVQVNAFTDQPDGGNPAAVCILTDPSTTYPYGDRWMQALATNLNLSETAFVVREDEGFNLRWFTPTMEVDLCGHATLAAAHVLYESGFSSWNQRRRSGTPHRTSNNWPLH